LLWAAPALILTVVPWQVIVVLLLGVAAAAVSVRPARRLMGLQLAAVLIAISWQVIFAVFAADISSGTLG
jgi:hypothetical protein